MTESLWALLANSLDYAGLFPPAALDMPSAVAEFERHLSHDPIGMLASFVCPAARLDELAQNTHNKTWRLSILATNADTASEALELLAKDAARIDSFLAVNRTFSISTLELRVPPALLETPVELEEFLGRVEDVALRFRYVPRRIFYEMGWSTPWNAVLPALKQGPMFRGAKVRTGGLNSQAFPSPEQVGAFLLEAAETRVPWKATAGLHHPVRRFQSEVETKMHGFLNVLLGAALAFQTRDEPALIALLSEEDATAFRFGDMYAKWRNHVFYREFLSEMRGEFALSFGSCSYQEPIDDLKELGLL